MKIVRLKVLSLALLLIIAVPAQNAFGISAAQRALYNSGINKFDIDTGESETETCGSSAAPSNSGSSNAEYIWNYFTAPERGLTPVATAGIMGNFSEETYGLFDPAVKQNKARFAIPDAGDGVTGFGIAQWTSAGRQAGLFAKIKEAGLQQYYGDGWGNPEKDKEIPTADVQKLLDIELQYAWDGDSTKIKDIAEQLNAAQSTEGDSGSAVLFHALFERSADKASQIQERVDAATAILNDYSGTEGTSSCAGTLGGVSTLEDGIPWAMKFVEMTESTYHPGGHSLNEEKDGENRINLYVTNDDPVSGGPIGGCWGALWCGQCTALTGWFVMNMTSVPYNWSPHGDGGSIVPNLAAHGAPTGNEPKPFSVFSTSKTSTSAGHTGVVLGVFDDGEVITMENNLGANTLSILHYNIKEKYSDVTFAYVGDKLNVSGINPDE